jgi:hypothetical protein
VQNIFGQDTLQHPEQFLGVPEPGEQCRWLFDLRPWHRQRTTWHLQNNLPKRGLSKWHFGGRLSKVQFGKLAILGNLEDRRVPLTDQQRGWIFDLRSWHQRCPARELQSDLPQRRGQRENPQGVVPNCGRQLGTDQRIQLHQLRVNLEQKRVLQCVSQPPTPTPKPDLLPKLSGVTIFNCDDERRTVVIWLRRAETINGPWTWEEQKTLTHAWSGPGLGSTCPVASASNVTLMFEDNVIYQVVVVVPKMLTCGGKNDPSLLNCLGATSSLVGGDASASKIQWNFGNPVF